MRALVGRLSSDDIHDREIAQRALERLGADALPILEGLDPEEPEARRILGLLHRGSGALRVEASPPEGPYPLGSVLQVEILVQNISDSRLLLPPGGLQARLVFPRGGGDALPDDVARAAERDLTDATAWAMPPGSSFRFLLSFAAERLPIRRPGRLEAYVRVRAAVASPEPGEEEKEGPPGDTPATDIEGTTARFAIDARGRTPEELRAALESGNDAERRGAVAELSVRDEGVFLPLLREAAERLGSEARVFAIRRLGEAAREEDLPRILEATKRKNDPKVRSEAVLALARFPQEAAFWKLLDLAGDDALQREAIDALRSHRRPLTVARFIRLLRYPKHLTADAAKRISDILYDWTGVYVRVEDPKEVLSFEEWWRENQASFSDK